MAAGLAAHLRACADCAKELDLVRASRSPEQETAYSLSLENLLDRIRRASLQEDTAHIRSRLASEVSRWLGGRATGAILETVPETGENLLSSFEPVLALFLGTSAASRLVDRVVDRAIVRS